MSYTIDLDEHPTQDLLDEIKRRTDAIVNGNCPYCKAPMATHTCRYKGCLDEYHNVQSGSLIPDSENSKIKKTDRTKAKIGVAPKHPFGGMPPGMTRDNPVEQ